MTARAASGAVCLAVSQWPAGDRDRWEQVLSGSSGPFRNQGADPMGPHTIRHLQASYGRFLSFLEGQGLLDPNASPMG